jgi:uncharacterized membrane protein YphA (DoxX/SURF4 family)
MDGTAFKTAARTEPQLYKMQEFFDVWSRTEALTGIMHWLYDYAFSFSLITITLEIVVGVAILLGYRKKFFIWLLLILILFFTFLTGYAALSGKIATCGCFGDCIPLTSMQSFIKDLVLIVLILILFIGQKYIIPPLTTAFNFLIMVGATLLVIFFQWWVLRHNPLVDCLPFKIGNNILELRKMPADAIPDVKDYVFIYKKDGKEQQFSVKDLPDSSWEFVSRNDVIIKKGKNNEPPIKDYSLMSLSGNDSTEAILKIDTKYYLFYVKDVQAHQERWLENFKRLYEETKSSATPIYIISPQAEKTYQYFNVDNNYNLPVFSMDGTAFKTAARTEPQLYKMHGPLVKNKWGWADIGKAFK